MADLNIPNLNRKAEKYLFKNKLTLRKKSKKKLFLESIYMSVLGSILMYFIYLIPNKILLFKTFFSALEKSYVLSIKLFSSLYQVALVVFIFFTLTISFILFFGSFYRLFKVIRRKNK